MTTKNSPLSALKTQADLIARTIKAAERGEKIDVKFAEKIIAARNRPSIKFAIAMDDKIITIDMPWSAINGTSEVELAFCILERMQEKRRSS
jgi:hypothetical protein